MSNSYKDLCKMESESVMSQLAFSVDYLDVEFVHFLHFTAGSKLT